MYMMCNDLHMAQNCTDLRSILRKRGGLSQLFVVGFLSFGRGAILGVGLRVES